LSGTLPTSSPLVSVLSSLRPTVLVDSSHSSSDINIPIFLILYFGYKFVKRTNIRSWEERDFVTGIPTPEETEIPEVPPRNVWEKIASVIF
jgi:amino acid transporter